MNLLSSILVVLVMGASLQRCRRALAAPAAPQPHIKPPCVDEEISFTADQQYELYIDGSAVGSLPNANTWQVAKRTTMLSTAKVLSFKATRIEGRDGGLLVSGSRFVTDGSWKCTNKYEKGWSGVNFDDSAWPRAVVVGNHGMSPFGYIPDISNAAKWIWTTKYIYGQETDIIIYCRKTRDYCECTGTGQSCVSDCESVDGDGNYQSCLGCQFYASCYYGYLYDEQPCEEEGFVWDDNSKSCEKQSSTCKCCSNNATTTTVAITTQPTSKTTRATTVCTSGPTCITSCTYGLPDGYYQLCKGCDVYANCSNGELAGELSCGYEEQLFWDDNEKCCLSHSTTCQSCPNEEATTTTTSLTVTDDRKPTTTSEVCPTESQHVSSCCNTGDDSSCYNTLFFFICKIILHL